MNKEEAIREMRMTNEEAIRFLKDHEYWSDFSFMDEVAEIAIFAIEKQIPQKPVGRHTDMHCPVCGARVRSGNGSSSRVRDTVCRHCYQVMDWSKEERRRRRFITEEMEENNG